MKYRRISVLPINLAQDFPQFSYSATLFFLYPSRRFQAFLKLEKPS